jgi:hypothetical protein
MSRGLRRFLGWLAVTASACLWTGCVERRFVVVTDPPTAMVYENGRPLGASPADDHYVYYGRYHFTLIKDGFQTLQVDQDIPPPWYEYPVLDFISENMIPWTIRDVRQFHYSLAPMRVTNPKEFLQEAEGMRAKGRSLEPPPNPANPPPPPAPVPVPAGPTPPP